MMDDARIIENVGREAIFTLVFSEDEKHLLSGGGDGMIRKWCVKDGTQVGEPVKASVGLGAIVLSNDRKWIVRGEYNWVVLWDRDTCLRVLTVAEHTSWVLTVDISPESTRLATGAMDRKVFIWDILTGGRLVGPLSHVDQLTSVKFSPDGNHIATSTWNHTDLRIYHSHTGQWLRTIAVATSLTNPIVWSNDSQHIFSLSTSAIISKFSVTTGACLCHWTIPGMKDRTFVSIALASNGRFIASFMGQCLSFWDPSTGAQLGPVFEHHGGRLNSMALSLENNHIAIGGEDGIIAIRNLNNILPSSYLGGQSVVRQPQSECCADLQLQVKALHDDIDELRGIVRNFKNHVWKSLLEMEIVQHGDDLSD